MTNISNKYINKKINESLTGAYLTGVGVASISLLISYIIDWYNTKVMSCNHIDEPIGKYECYMALLDSTINHLNNAIVNQCDKTADPAECKLRLMNKIEKMQRKKDVIQLKLDKLYNQKLKNSIN